MSHRHDPQQLNQPGVPKDEFALEEIIREFSPKKKRAPQSKLSDDTMAFTPVTAQSRPPKPTDAQDTTVLPRIPDVKLSTKPAMPPEPMPAACSSDTVRLPRIPDGKIYTKQPKQSEKKAAALTSATLRGAGRAAFRPGRTPGRLPARPPSPRRIRSRSRSTFASCLRPGGGACRCC